MKIFNDRGYTLILSLGIILLFTILGISLFTLTSNVATKNIARDNTIHATNLAEKSEKNFVQDFNTTIQGILDKENGIDRNEFAKILDDFTDLTTNARQSSYTLDFDISKYKCKYNASGKIISALNSPVNNASDKSFSCIKMVQPVLNEDGTINDLKKTLVVYHYGLTNNKPSSFETTIEIGSNYIPEQLFYAMTSKDGSDIHLNGSIEIIGDIKVGRYMTLSNRAYFNNGYWATTTYPLIRPTDLSKQSRIVISDPRNIYTINSNPTDTGTTLYNNLSPTFRNNTQTNLNLKSIGSSFSNYLDLPGNLKNPVLTTNSSVEQEIKIGEKEANFKLKNPTTVTPSDKTKIKPSEVNNKSVKLNASDSCGFSCNYVSLKDSTYNITEMETIQNLKIINSTVKIAKTLYVKGNLIINNNVDISGNIFVNGNITIETANLTSNAMIYTNGNVTITNSTLNSTRTNTGNGTLLVFAKGDVKLSNISQYKSQSSKIYGYFYSEKLLEIYGVGSNVEIHGGVYGNKIKLNAVRGLTSTSRPADSSNYSRIDSLYIRNVQNLTKTCTTTFIKENSCYDTSSQSRLKIYYDDNVIKTFIELDNTTQIIDKIDPPITKTKQIIP